MIEQVAKVLRVDKENVLIEVQRQAECGSCSVKAGCGKSLLDNVFKNKNIELSILNTVNAKENDNVVVGLNETMFVRVSFFLYVIPLLCMITLSAVVNSLNVSESSELYTILAGFIGLFFGAYLTRFFLKFTKDGKQEIIEPTLIKVIPTSIPINLNENLI